MLVICAVRVCVLVQFSFLQLSLSELILPYTGDPSIGVDFAESDTPPTLTLEFSELEVTLLKSATVFTELSQDVQL